MVHLAVNSEDAVICSILRSKIWQYTLHGRFSFPASKNALILPCDEKCINSPLRVFSELDIFLSHLH